jgi:hypothetical protein
MFIIRMPSDRGLTFGACGNSWLTTTLTILLIILWSDPYTIISYMTIQANLSYVVIHHMRGKFFCSLK